MSKEVTNALKYWQHIMPLLSMPTNEKEYDQLVSYQDELLALCADNKNHLAWNLVNLISDIIAKYDAENYSISQASGVDVLKYLMHEHRLKQADLSGLGSQGVVSEILSGKRKLNIKQIQWLCKRFNLSADTFIDLNDDYLESHTYMTASNH